MIEAGAASLTADERVPGRGFTDPDASGDDLAALAVIRAAQRARVLDDGGGGTWTGRDGATHWLVAPRPNLLRQPEPCLAIGFFGNARADLDHSAIISLEHAMLDRAAELNGLLSYHNVQLANGQWGNLVLFESGTDTSSLRRDPDHAEAIGLAPRHYSSVRLHRGSLPDGPLGRREIEVATTLYLDFEVSPPWRAVRTSKTVRNAGWDLRPRSVSQRAPCAAVKPVQPLRATASLVGVFIEQLGRDIVKRRFRFVPVDAAICSRGLVLVWRSWRETRGTSGQPPQ